MFVCNIVKNLLMLVLFSLFYFIFNIIFIWICLIYVKYVFFLCDFFNISKVIGYGNEIGRLLVILWSLCL